MPGEIKFSYDAGIKQRAESLFNRKTPLWTRPVRQDQPYYTDRLAGVAMPDQSVGRICIEFVFLKFVLEPIRVFVSMFQAVYAVSQPMCISRLLLGKYSFRLEKAVKSVSKAIQLIIPPDLFIYIYAACVYSYRW